MDNERRDGDDVIANPDGGAQYCEPCLPHHNPAAWTEFTITTDPALPDRLDLDITTIPPEGYYFSGFWINFKTGKQGNSWSRLGNPNELVSSVTLAKPTTCPTCNGTRLVNGFLGVGIQIPCGQCGGEGVV